MCTTVYLNNKGHYLFNPHRGEERTAHRLTIHHIFIYQSTRIPCVYAMCVGLKWWRALALGRKSSFIDIDLSCSVHLRTIWYGIPRSCEFSIVVVLIGVRFSEQPGAVVIRPETDCVQTVTICLRISTVRKRIIYSTFHSAHKLFHYTRPAKMFVARTHSIQVNDPNERVHFIDLMILLWEWMGLQSIGCNCM